MQHYACMRQLLYAVPELPIPCICGLQESKTGISNYYKKSV